tara:strand:- start:686 stop:1750 length:1065 start_codon:yes stop_codon:yes gene_type:complete
MFYNREEKCTNEMKEKYLYISRYLIATGIYILLLFILSIFDSNRVLSLFEGLLLLIYVITILGIISTIYYKNTRNPYKNNFILNIEKLEIKLFYAAILFFTTCFIISLVNLFYLLIKKQDTFTYIYDNWTKYIVYLVLVIKVLVLLSFLFIWIFGPCDKIIHSCNLESWPSKFKSDDKKDDREEICNNLNETCMDDMNKTEDECGTCSNTNYNNKDDCTDNDGEWTSRYTKCFWSKPTDRKVSSCDIVTDSPPLAAHEGSCIYDINKCGVNDSICDDFQPTSIFYNCCSKKTIGWQENMPQLCDTLRTQIEENKTEEGRIGGGSQREGELEAEYKLRVAASNQTSHIQDEDLYK